MALRLIDREGRPDPRRIEPAEERGLRAIKAGDATGDARAVCRDLLDYARRRKLWIECDCLDGDTEAPVIVPRRGPDGRYALANRPFARTLHAEDCVFRRGELKPAGAGACRPSGPRRGTLTGASVSPPRQSHSIHSVRRRA